MKTPGSIYKMYIYILLCNDGNNYTGVTNDLENRLAQHHSGYFSTCYTFYRRPLKLALYEGFTSIVKSIEIEKQIKKWSRKKKVALINGDFDLLIEFAKKEFI